MTGILATRYASDEMNKIWSRKWKIRKERELWLTILRVQERFGLSVDISAISDYEKVIDDIDLESIDLREKKLQHDVMARIEEFNELAGHQKIHIGMTSRDLTENIELFQIKQSLELILQKSNSLLANFSEFIEKNRTKPMVARTHNVPAQVTTLGRKFSSWAEELLFALNHLHQLISRLPLKGIKGAIGTEQDLYQIFGEHSSEINSEISNFLGFEHHLRVPSQIYPRSLDFEVVSTLSQLASAPSNMALNIRLLSGFGLVSEGFTDNQVGSSAMPHKVNPRLSERVNGLHTVLKGYVVMTQELAGTQWNEGDVSCSVVRRVALPDAFFAADAILDNSIRILKGLTIFDEQIKIELDANLPFLLSSKLLVLAVENGVNREIAHKAIKELATTARRNLLEGGNNNFIELISKSELLKITNEQIGRLTDIQALTTSAVLQTDSFLQEVNYYLDKNTASAWYEPNQSI